MSRDFKPTDRFVHPEPKYNSKLVQKLINCLMVSGKKSLATRMVYRAMDIVGQKVKTDEPLKVLMTALENVRPMLEVRSRRVGGQNLQVPVEVGPKRAQSLSIRWLIEAARSVKGKPSEERLAAEIIAAYKREGTAVTKRDNVHKMAEANKAFAHFAW